MCVCVVGGGGGGGDNAIELSIIMHFLCGRSQTRLKNVSEIWNLDLNLELDLDLHLESSFSRALDLDSI